MFFCFRTGGWSNAHVSTPGILTCDAYRKFWATWDDHVVRFGRGWKVGDEEVIEQHRSDSLDIKYLAVSSYSGTDGHVIFIE